MVWGVVCGVGVVFVIVVVEIDDYFDVIVVDGDFVDIGVDVFDFDYFDGVVGVEDGVFGNGIVLVFVVVCVFVFVIEGVWVE